MKYPNKFVLFSISTVCLASLATSAQADGTSGRLIPQTSSSPNQTVHQAVNVNVNPQEDHDKQQPKDEVSIKDGFYPDHQPKQDVQPTESWLTKEATSTVMVAGGLWLLVVRRRKINIRIEIK